jgi:hypothetical protein
MLYLASLATALLMAAVTVFTPPRLVSGEPPGLPGPMIVGGGEVLVDATIDKRGAVTHPVIIRDTQPYGQMVLDAISKWRFTPAVAPGADGKDEVVDAPVLIAAVYRSPALYNGPSLGPPPADAGRASGAIPYPTAMPAPGYPPQAMFGDVVLLEVSLDDAGNSRGVRVVKSNQGFDGVARDAVSRWKFRGASFRSRPVPSIVYVIMGFTPPNGAATPTPPTPTPR